MFAACSPPCIATSATPGRSLQRDHVADREDLGVAGKRAGRAAPRSARRGRSRRRSRRRAAAASGDAWTPAAQTTVRGDDALGAAASSRRRRRVASTSVTRASIRSSTPRSSSWRTAAVAAEPITEGREWLLAAVDEQHAHGRRIERTEVAAQAPDGELADLPGELDAGRAGADDDDREPFPPFLGRRWPSRPSRTRRGCGAAARARRRSSSCRARRARTRRGRSTTAPTPAATIRLSYGHLDGSSADPVACTIRRSRSNPVDLGQLDPDVSPAAQHVAQRRRDLARRQHAGRHLVQQRLEEVVVPSVDAASTSTPSTCPRKRATGSPPKLPAHDHVVRHSSSMRARVVRRPFTRCSCRRARPRHLCPERSTATDATI